MNYLQLLDDIRTNVAKNMVGKRKEIDLILIAMLCGGHVLVEDVPGLGKTTMVSSLAQSLGCTFRRIQFTPDVLPSDITGFTMYNIKSGEQEVHTGSIMSQIVLADEINRTSPKTQSALLEAMQEGQVSIDGKTYPLPRPFIVLATQNPVELVGTYPLPEAQMDRFLLCIHMGYPNEEEEVEILTRHQKSAAQSPLDPVATAGQVLLLQEALDHVHCSTAVKQYIVRLVEATREHPDVQLGVSPRGSIALMRASMAMAMMEGRGYVIPDDVQALVIPVLSHRLVMTSQAMLEKTGPLDVLQKVLSTVPVPRVSS